MSAHDASKGVDKGQMAENFCWRRRDREMEKSQSLTELPDQKIMELGVMCYSGSDTSDPGCQSPKTKGVGLVYTVVWKER